MAILQLERSAVIALTVACALFMENLDGTVIATALPQIAESFAVSPVHLSLAITSYLLSVAIFIPASGWTADRFGARTVFLAAIAVFMLGSILCGLSGSIAELTGARILQGIGGAMKVPIGRLVLLRNVTKADMVRAMSYLTVPALLGPVLGPPVGGFIVTYASWRIGDDEAADRRTEHRPQQRRHGEVGHRAHHVGLGDVAQQDEASDRHHHGAADPLQDACAGELGNAAAQPAQDRAEHEDGDGGAKDGARAEAVGHPAARRNEDGDAEEIGGDRQAEMDRADGEGFGDLRQRRGDHRAVEILHEKRAGDGQRDDCRPFQLEDGHVLPPRRGARG